MDFKQICRICLEKNKQTYDIYTSYYSKRNTLYSEMLSNCTKLQPFVEDGLPRLICKECSRQLKRTYSFNIQCENSDKTLKDLLQKSEFKVKLNTVDCSVKTEDGGDSFTSVADCERNALNTDYSDVKVEDKSNISILNEHREEYIANKDTKEESSDIKVEHNYNDADDSCWEPYEDTVLLEEIKPKNKLKENCINNCKDNWDADDDNVLLKEIKLRKFKEKRVIENKPKKRGRKKKVYLEGETPSIPESKLPHQCDICGKFLSTKSNLKTHKICHTDLRPYKCPDCPAAFRGYSALFQHKRIHSGETPYHCEYCSKQFRRRTGLVNHIRMHTGEKLYSCDICFKTFIQSAQLSIHMKRHKGDKSYLCQDCGKGFPVKADLRVHQRIHNGEKPYSCHMCTKTFTTSGNLSIHVRIHKKEIRYHCSECQRGFVTNSAYNVHLKRHKNQRDYLCDCGKTFFTSSALKQHKVVHTGEKNYQCKICDRKFSQNSHLNRHFKRDHGKPNAPLPAPEQYKIVLSQESKNNFVPFDVPKMAPNVNAGVKCEGS